MLGRKEPKDERNFGIHICNKCLEKDSELLELKLNLREIQKVCLKMKDNYDAQFPQSDQQDANYSQDAVCQPDQDAAYQREQDAAYQYPLEERHIQISIDKEQID